MHIASSFDEYSGLAIRPADFSAMVTRAAAFLYCPALIYQVNCVIILAHAVE